MIQCAQRSRTSWYGLALVLAIGLHAMPSVLMGQTRARTPHVTASILPEARSFRPGAPLRVAIRLSIAPGWHIYWTNPGESGVPTTVRWEGPPGFAVGPLRWPYPVRKEFGGLVVHAYEDEVVLMGEVHPPADLAVGGHAEVSAWIRWGVCRDVCIPQEVRLSFRLPVRDGPPRAHPRWAATAAAAAPSLPQTLRGWKVGARWHREELELRIEPPPGADLPHGPLTFFPENPTLLGAAATAELERDGEGGVLPLKGADRSAGAPRLRGILVAASGWGSSRRFPALRVDVPLEMPCMGTRDRPAAEDCLQGAGRPAAPLPGRNRLR